MGDGKKLKELIERKRTNVRRIAKATGIPATTLYSIIQKDSGIRLDMALKLAVELGIDVNEICSDTISDVADLLISFYQLDDEARKEILEMMKIKMKYHKEKERIG